jgi:hypothetical protein
VVGSKGRSEIRLYKVCTQPHSSNNEMFYCFNSFLDDAHVMELGVG